MLHADEQVQRLGHRTRRRGGDGGAPHLREEAFGHVEVTGFGFRLGYFQLGAGRRDMGRNRPGGSCGGNVVDQGVGGAGENIRLHRGRKQRIAEALAQVTQALVGPGLAHGEADDRAHHQAEHDATQPAGDDGNAGGRDHGGGGHCGNRDVGCHLEHTAEDVGHHRGVVECITQPGGPERVRHAGCSSGISV